MSIRSMTGQGRGELAANGVKVTVELRAVNHRQFEARLDLPPALAALEPALRARLHERIARGYINCRVHLDFSSARLGEACRVDYDLAAAIVKRLRQAGRRLGLRDDLRLGVLIGIPGVITVAEAPVKPDLLGPQVVKCLDRALKLFLAMRVSEGRALEKDVAARLSLLGGVVNEIAGRAPVVAAAYRRALQARLRKAGVALAESDERLIREVALFADRSDISEEGTRLRSHLRQARSYLEGTAPAGRALDFLLQEMFREINTIGSKVNDARASGMVVKAKSELERIREQVQNIE